MRVGGERGRKRDRFDLFEVFSFLTKMCAAPAQLCKHPQHHPAETLLNAALSRVQRDLFEGILNSLNLWRWILFGANECG